MATVYLDEQGSELKKKGELLIVEKDGSVISELPLAQVDRLVIVGNVQITTQALAMLFDNEIPVSFMTSYGNYRGRLKPPTHKNVMLRLKQYERYNDHAFRLGHAKKIVAAKLKNGKTFLQKHSRNNPEIGISDETSAIDALMKKIENAGSAGELMGIEGAAAREYFKAFGRLVKNEFRFEKRTKRPPTDPVNALLSFGYTMLFNELYTALEALGFDPYLGFLHAVDYSRPSLAVDMVEEFRYLIDGLALMLINKGMLETPDFVFRDDGGVYLRPA